MSDTTRPGSFAEWINTLSDQEQCQMLEALRAMAAAAGVTVIHNHLNAAMINALASQDALKVISGSPPHLTFN